MEKRIVSVTGLFFSATLLLCACGGGTPAPDERSEPDTTGGELTGDAGDASDDVADPCADSAESPCEDGVARGAGDGADNGIEGETAEGEGETAEGEGETAEGEDEAAGSEAPPTQEEWTALVREGRRWFNRRCDTCHPGGEEDIGPTLRRIHWGQARMLRQIRRGSGRMRPIPVHRLPDESVPALMAYLSTFGAVVGVRRPEAEPE